MSKLSQYEAFVTVFETGNVSLASDRLNRTSSSISKQITNLETNLGIQLFDRSNKKMVATELGKQFYRSSASILRQIDAAEHQITVNSNEIAGDINISLSKSLLGSKLTHYLNEFADRHPHTRYTLKVSEELTSFNDCELDFAFRIGKVADSTRLVAKELCMVTPIFYATPEYLSRYGTPTKLSDLYCHRLALPPLENLSSELRKWLKSQRFVFDNDSHHVIDDVNTIQELTLNHGCIGFNLESSLADQLKQNTFVKLFPNQLLPSKPLFLVYRKAQYPPAHIEAFKCFVLDKYT